MLKKNLNEPADCTPRRTCRLTLAPGANGVPSVIVPVVTLLLNPPPLVWAGGVSNVVPKTVMVQGEYQELEDEWERYYAVKAFVDCMLHLKISETSLSQDAGEIQRSRYLHRNNRSAIYRIVIDQKSGRYECD